MAVLQLDIKFPINAEVISVDLFVIFCTDMHSSIKFIMSSFVRPDPRWQARFI